MLCDAISRPNGLKVPNYGGYTNGEGFLAPCRGTRYHLFEWRDGHTPSHHEKYFNMKHASAKNVIERCFGLIKARWGILRSPSFYPIKTQCRIITACCLLHNLIRREMSIDPIEHEINELEDGENMVECDILGIIELFDQWLQRGMIWPCKSVMSGEQIGTTTWNIGCIGMESGTVHNFESSVKKGTRRKWLPFEEDALLTILEDFVTRGHRCDMGSFKFDTLHNKEAERWLNKSFPIYDKFANIFGKDCAIGKGSEVPMEMMEEQSHNEVNPSDIAAENESSMSQGGNHSENSERKRKRGTENSSDGIDKIVLALEKLFAESGKRMQMVTKAIMKGNKDHSDIAKMLKDISLSLMDQIDALTLILEKPQIVVRFQSLDDDSKKCLFKNCLMTMLEDDGASMMSWL
ncbi:unnamed protein product [Prunus armeniaca]